MLLTSIYRARLYIGSEKGNPISDTIQNRRVLLNMITAVSDKIEKELKRLIKIESRVQYFDVDKNTFEFFPEAYPILRTPAPTVEEDSSGLWSGNEATVSDSAIGAGQDSIFLPTVRSYNARNAIRITYTGGLAYHAVNSVFEVTVNDGTPTANKFIVGVTSKAIGIVNAWDDTNDLLTIENYYGIFEDGEILHQYNTEAEAFADAGSETANITIDDINKQSLAEAHNGIVRACEIQLAYMRRHMNDFENAGTTKEGATIRRSFRSATWQTKMVLIDEALAALEGYHNTNWGV